MTSESEPPKLECGVYRSHKDKLYRVIGLAQNSTNGEQDGEWMVEYYDSPVKYAGDLAIKHVRNYEEFFDEVPDPNDETEMIPRFSKAESQY